MKVLVTFLAALTAAAEGSLLPTYGLPPQPPPLPPPTYNGGGISCPDWQIFHNGRCFVPEVTRNVHVYNIPHIPKPPGIRPPVPHPKVEHNILFVRLPEELGEEEPIVVPPPQQKNIVYVLKEESDRDGPGVIHVPAPPKSNPEVYFVNVGQGENPLLPTGEDLQSALSNSGAELNAQVVGGGDSLGPEISTNYGHPEIINSYEPPFDPHSVLYRPS
ncbi:uncharacterized protein [Macrobrachium rosenbergii]|uniref:uncharacterized protein n=1 Tax=Macrobrachium rosenbergii TaxID=79674 RepID=UPI0034D68734